MAGDRKPWPERTREKIRVGDLIRRLTLHAMGEKDDGGNLVKMTTTQVKAAVTLIDKVLPNLQSIEQLVWNANEGMTESEAKAKLVELANKNPELTRILAKHFIPLESKPAIESTEYAMVDDSIVEIPVYGEKTGESDTKVNDEAN